MRDLKDQEIDKRIREHDRKLFVIDFCIGAVIVVVFTLIFGLWV